jgi:hypothetical protein
MTMPENALVQVACRTQTRLAVDRLPVSALG